MSTKKVYNPVITTPGDLQSRRNQVIGPFKLFLKSGERDETGELIFDAVEQPDGSMENKPRKDEVPFLSNIFFKKNVMTIRREEEFEHDKKEYVEKGLMLTWYSKQLSYILHSWDLKDGGKDVPPTFEGITSHEVDFELIDSILDLHREVTRPPKA
jgi:hypothetical protein